MRRHVPRAATALGLGIAGSLLTGCVRDPGPPQQATPAEVASVSDLTIMPVGERSLDAVLAELSQGNEDRAHLTAEYLFAAGRLDPREEAQAIARLRDLTAR